MVSLFHQAKFFTTTSGFEEGKCKHCPFGNKNTFLFLFWWHVSWKKKTPFCFTSISLSLKSGQCPRILGPRRAAHMICGMLIFCPRQAVQPVQIRKRLGCQLHLGFLFPRPKMSSATQIQGPLPNEVLWKKSASTCLGTFLCCALC